MANEVTNNLEIICEDEKTLNKIRMMIFDEDIHKNVKFTMERMLPKPPWVSKSRGYSEYGYYWAPAIWGTKSDVYDCFITDSGNTITINYLTDWRPNVTWVNLLCCYIEMATTPLSPEEISAISVKLHYYDYMGNFGGFWEWVPNEKPNTNEYSIMEYAKLHDNDLFEWVTEYREFCKSV